MESTITTPAALTQPQIDRLYALHKRVYFDRGIGHPPEIWREHLFRNYHGVCSKYVQLFRTADSPQEIDGYTICTAPVECAAGRWIKIIEAGLTLTGNRRDTREAFVRMLSALVNGHIGESDQSPSFIAEIDVESENIASLLLDRVGFVDLTDNTLAHSVLGCFLEGVDFSIRTAAEGRSLISERKTAIKQHYSGRITVYGVR